MQDSSHSGDLQIIIGQKETTASGSSSAKNPKEFNGHIIPCGQYPKTSGVAFAERGSIWRQAHHLVLKFQFS
jgi:hypothetical protein